MVEATVNKNMRKRERRGPQGSSWARDKQEAQVRSRREVMVDTGGKVEWYTVGGVKHILSMLD